MINSHVTIWTQQNTLRFAAIRLKWKTALKETPTENQTLCNLRGEWQTVSLLFN